MCNACESLLVHKNILDSFIPLIEKRLAEKQVEIRGDESILKASVKDANVIVGKPCAGIDINCSRIHFV